MVPVKLKCFRVLLVSCLFLSGCAGLQVKSSKEPVLPIPQSISVLPLIDDRLDKRKMPAEDIQSLIATVLYGLGYDVPETKQTNAKLKEKNTQSENLVTIDVKELCSVLGTEGVLKTTVYDFESAYKGFYRTDRLEMELIIYNNAGESVWKNRLVKHQNYVGGLLGSAVPTSISGWIRLEAFQGLPRGQKYKEHTSTRLRLEWIGR